MGLTTETLYDNRLAVFRLEDMTRETIDAWFEAHADWIRNTPDHQPTLILLDCSAQSMAFSPYLRTRATQLIHTFANRQGYMVLLVANRFWKETMQFFFRSQQRTARVTFKVMTDRDEALTWLVEQDPTPISEDEH